MGISTDTAEKAKAFRESLKAPFPFLADTDATVSKAYGVYDESGNYAKRVTFVVSSGGTISFVERDNLAAEGAAGACPLPAPKKKNGKAKKKIR